MPASVATNPANAPAELSASAQRMADWKALSKPGITNLVLVTVAAGAFLAAWTDRLELPLLKLLATMVGSLLVVVGANIINQVLERDTDALMKRTRLRPIPAGRVAPMAGWGIAMACTVAGATILLVGANQIAMWVALLSWALYSFAYTPLKRHTSLATIVGAVPGALPPVIGWTAVAGVWERGAWCLFAIMFLWQFPHFLALGWMFREDYARGGLPQLSAADPTGGLTARQSMVYASALVPVSLVPTMFGLAGPVYFVVALVLSLGYLYMAARCVTGIDMDRRVRMLFRYSIIYLPVLLGVLIAEAWWMNVSVS